MSRFNLKSFDWLAPSSDSDAYIEHEVWGKLFHFYPLSPLKLPLFQKTFKVIGKSLRELTYKHKDEAGIRDVNDSRQGHEHAETTYIPMTVEMSKEHAKRRAESMDALVELVTEEKNLLTVAMCVMDSMREDVPRDIDKPFTEADAKVFLQSHHMSIPLFLQLTMGMVKANLDSFGTLGKKMARKAVSEVENLLAEREVPGPPEKEAQVPMVDLTGAVTIPEETSEVSS